MKDDRVAGASCSAEAPPWPKYILLLSITPTLQPYQPHWFLPPSELWAMTTRSPNFTQPLQAEFATKSEQPTGGYRYRLQNHASRFIQDMKTKPNVTDETRQPVPTASICRYVLWVGLKIAKLLPPAGVNTSFSDRSPRFKFRDLAALAFAKRGRTGGLFGMGNIREPTAALKLTQHVS